MDLFQLIILLVVVGIIMWAVNRFIPMEANIKKILNIAVAIIMVLFLLSLFVGYLPHVHVGR